MQLRLYITISFLLSAMMLNAQTPFTHGNIVVTRVGDGSQALTSNARHIFLDEYTPSGNFVRSVSLPVAGLMGSDTTKRLTFPGNDVNLGILSLSVDGRFLTIVGFDVAPYTINSQVLLASVSRVIGRVDFSGRVNTSTGLTDAGGQNALGTVTTNGVDLWSCFFQGGLRYTTLGSSTSVQVVSPPGTGNPFISNGQLFYSSTAGALFKVGNGISTTGPQIASAVPGLNAYNTATHYFFADLNTTIPGNDVIYLAGRNSALRKYSFNGTTWVHNGTIGINLDSYGSVTGVVNQTSVTLYATRNLAATSGGSQLVSLVDNSGHNGAFSGTPTILNTAGLNTAFRGIAMAPVKCKLPLLRLGTITPTSAEVFITDSLDASNAYEYEVSLSPTPSGSGIATNVNIISDNSLLPGSHYYIHIRRSCGGGDFSPWNTVDFITTWPPCVSPVIQNPIVLSSNSMTLSWQSVFTAIQYEFAVTSLATPPLSGIITNTTSAVSFLSSATSYYLHVRAYCGGGDTSAWATRAFISPCFDVTPYLIRNDVASGTAELGWNGESGLNTYEYAIMPLPVPPYGTLNSTIDTLLSVSNLNPGTTYYLYVRKKCYDKSISSWSMVAFNTSGVGVYPNPFKDQITIRVVGQGNATIPVRIYDDQGRLFRICILTGSSTTVDTKGWASGMYYVQYGNAKGFVTTIIKQ